MHSFIVSASLQIIPIVQDHHPYQWVDDAIAVIQSSGVKYDIGPFATSLEGPYEDVMKLINDVNEYLFSRHCKEWIANVQIQIRSDDNITTDEKIAKFKL